MKPILKIKYILDNDDMTDEQFEDQEERVFIVTEQMLIELMEQNVKLKPGDSIDRNNLYFEVI